DIIPPPAVEPGRVLSQLIEDLVHFEDRGESLDQHRRLDRAASDAKRFLRVEEDVVPDPRFAMAFELREVEIRSRSPGQELVRVVKEIEAKIQEAPRNRPSFKGDVALGEVEPARAHQEHGGLLMETVLLARGRIVEGEPSANRVAEVELPF